MDGQAFMSILNWYGLEDEVGLFIYKNHPQLADKIYPALMAGLGPFESRMGKFPSQIHKDEFMRDYVTNLAQNALDALERSNSETNVPEAKCNEPEQAS